MKFPAEEIRTRLSAVPRAWLAGIAIVGLLFAAVAVALVLTAQPAFFARYADLSHSYDTLQESTHAGLRCEQCHEDPRGPVAYRASLVGEFFRGIAQPADAPALLSISAPTGDACRACHNEDWSHESTRTLNVPHPAHLRVADETRDCIECHKWTGHVEDYVVKHEAMPFSTVCASFGCHVGTKTDEECQNCHHTLQGEGDAWLDAHPDTVQAYGPNACLESCHDADQCRMCHTTGERPEFTDGPQQAAVKAIEREHVKENWLEQHGTLALEDEDKCYLCHVSPVECQECHTKRPAFHGPESTWIGQHKNAAEAEDDRRCLTCHDQESCDECHEQFEEMR